MSEKELVCTSLDNKSIKQKEETLENSYPTFGVQKQRESYPVTNGKSTICDAAGTTNIDKKTSVPQSYGIRALDHGLLENESQGSSSKIEEKEMFQDKTVNPSAKLDDASLENSNSANDIPKAFSSVDSIQSQKLTQGDQDDSDIEDFDEDVMTGSYGEISLDRELLNCDKNSDSISSRDDDRFFLDDRKGDPVDDIKEKKRPDSLVLAQSLKSKVGDPGSSNLDVQQVHQSQQTSEYHTSAEVSPSFSSEEFAVHSAGRVRTGSDTSGLSELLGTITVEGDLVTFVAEDLHEKIKMSSPVSRWAESSSFPGSRSSTPSLYRQALQPNTHIIDPNILNDLEAHAKKVATCVDTMLENLSGTLQSISSLTVDCMETYESSVCKTCDAVDVNIKAVYQLMAKCEELSNSMGPLYRMSGDIKHIKKMLEQLEHIVEHKS